ncbi:P-loop NTPase fold protein [Maribacter litoralis]|uniref:KAP NTPase domain-containing protein n=1 Tax=Maribacter litoralis TaxID=2059726 RepID=A0A653XCW4_9FLAO|nr:P-loop NTPase fold protein [Maribacter litoralis]VXC27891.1 conserved hypothetical protein [Maribacter litoralis]
MELKEKFRKCLRRMNKNKKDVANEFQFISEKPLDKGLLFGHGEMVTTLKRVIFKSPESFTIGLFGDWGSGKSSIAETLQSELQINTIPLLIFDVWKHEGDALRRTFIKETHHFFKNSKIWKKKYKGKDELLYNLSRSKKGIKRKPLTVWQLLRGAIFLPVSILVLGLLVWLITDKVLGLDYFQKDDIPGAVTTFLGLFSVSFLFKYAQKFIENIKGDKVEYIEEKIQDPIEFENMFKQLINNLDDEIKKVVFVFDNLDRVSGEKAIQIMSTIKTFLDPIDKSIKDKNIVFLIPCDETAIKRHLRKTLNYSKDFKGDDYHRYAGEYLRKFFNTILWIPEFYISELEDLAEKKLVETRIGDFKNDELSALIVLVFDKNPRQIIQFINILISNYLLIKERPIEGFSLKEDIAKLAKYLLLIQKFPDIISLYRNTLNYDLDSFPSELNEEIDQERKFSKKRVAEFNSFLKRTEHVRIESLDIFFKLRRSVFESKLENSAKLINLIATGQISEMAEYVKLGKEKGSDEYYEVIESTKEFVDNLDLEGKIHDLSQIMTEKIRKIKNPILLAKFVQGLLYFLEYRNIDLEPEVFRIIYNQLKQNGNNISEINPKLLLEKCYSKLVDISDRKTFKELISIKHIEDFVGAHKKTA